MDEIGAGLEVEEVLDESDGGGEVFGAEKVGVAEDLVETEGAGVELAVAVEEFFAEGGFGGRGEGGAAGDGEDAGGVGVFGEAGDEGPEEDAGVFFEAAADEVLCGVEEFFEVGVPGFEAFHPERFNGVEVAVAGEGDDRVFGFCVFGMVGHGDLWSGGYGLSGWDMIADDAGETSCRPGLRSGGGDG